MENLQDMLRIYYKRLFPYDPFFQWLTYGSSTFIVHFLSTLFEVDKIQAHDFLFSLPQLFGTPRILIYPRGRCLHSLSVFQSPRRFRKRSKATITA